MEGVRSGGRELGDVDDAVVVEEEEVEVGKEAEGAGGDDLQPVEGNIQLLNHFYA